VRRERGNVACGRRGAIGSGVVLDGEVALDISADVKMAKVLKVLKVLNF
jgi:hypothetical protein